MFRVLFGVVVGMTLIVGGAYLWLTKGHPPVATADAPLPFERQITSVPLNARIDREMPAIVPIQPSEANFVAGAHIYRQQCAFCHAVYGNQSKVGGHMFPAAPPLWEKHGNVVGVSDDPAGETYWKVANGIRLSGMPAYKEILSETEMWQVSLVLANADKPLPQAALTLLKQPLSFDPTAPVVTPANAGTAPPL